LTFSQQKGVLITTMSAPMFQTRFTAGLAETLCRQPMGTAPCSGNAAMSDLARTIDRLRELLEKATRGPFSFVSHGDKTTGFCFGTALDSSDTPIAGEIENDDYTVCDFIGDIYTGFVDATLIVEAINALPALLDELDSLHEAREKLATVEAVGFHTHPSWNCSEEFDAGWNACRKQVEEALREEVSDDS